MDCITCSEHLDRNKLLPVGVLLYSGMGEIFFRSIINNTGSSLRMEGKHLLFFRRKGKHL